MSLLTLVAFVVALALVFALLVDLILGGSVASGLRGLVERLHERRSRRG